MGLIVMAMLIGASAYFGFCLVASIHKKIKNKKGE